ncbi:MAG: DUF5667 domain-containing protein [Candidatus Kerfeldbacteria bacterium]
MKKSIIYSLLIAGLVLVPGLVFGMEEVEVDTTTITDQTDEVSKLVKEIEDELEDPGVLPDSPFYFVKEWSEGIQEFFTFDNEKKAELQYRFAMRRVAEVNKLVSKGKLEKAQEHMDKYDSHLEKFSEKVVKLKEKDADKAEALTDKLEIMQVKQQSVLADVYDKVPEEAKEGILNAMENSSKGLENAIEKIEGKEKLDSFKERFRNRIEEEYQDKSDEVQDSLKKRAKEMVDDALEGEDE